MAISIGKAVEEIVRSFGVKPRPGTVDTLKIGSPRAPLRGIVTTFMPTMEVLGKTVRRGANLVVAHEPLWYNHRDETARFKRDPVYRAKRRLLLRHRLAVFRTHDTWHDRNPDGILEGMVRKLAWGEYRNGPGSRYFRFPGWTVRRIALAARRALGTSAVRVVGDPALAPRVVAFSCGFGGAARNVAELNRPGVGAVVCGEDHEWETYEYARDASFLGRKKALIVLGHAASEEAGMEYLAELLDGRFPGVAVWFIPSGSPYRTF